MENVIRIKKSRAKGVSRVRWTNDDVEQLKRDFLAFVPTLEIARRLNRSEGTVRLRIVNLGLRRSSSVSKALAWAPDHLKEQLSELGPEAFVAACYEWRETQLASVDEKSAAAIAATCAEIDASFKLSRNEKMMAKRMAGMGLEEIAKQHGVTWQRVQQVTNPGVVARTRGFNPLSLIAKRLEAVEASRSELQEQMVKQLKVTWDSLSPEVQDEFLRTINAQRVQG